MGIDLAIVGHVGTETVHTPRGVASSLGGSALHTAKGAVACGCSTGLVTRVGRDFPLDDLRRLQIDTSGVQVVEGPSSHFDITYLPTFFDRTVQFALGVGSHLEAVDVPETYRSARVIHIATNLPSTQLSLLRELRRITSATLTLDCFDQFIRESPDMVRSCIAECDLYFANEDEQRLLSELGVSRKTHIIKRGARGADFIAADGAQFHADAPPADLVDPTGAGDVFAGAFIANTIAGFSVMDAMTRACRVASQSVEAFGSRAVEPSSSDMRSGEI